MLEQPRYAPYDESAFWSDGTPMRPKVLGTIARGDLLGSVTRATGPDGPDDAREVPLPVTRDLLATGRASFDVVCAACHGVLGDGVSVVATKMQERPPPSLHDPGIASLPPGRIFQVITSGYGLMMPMNSLLTVEERWAVVAYVQALVLSQSFDPSWLSPADRARVEAAP
jgi:mono/diheme cytochrome c family protein